MTVGEIIYSRRKELGLTLEEIGNATGVSKSTVKKWENGFIANMRRDKIEKLAKVLQISPIALLGIDDDYAQTLEVLQTIIDPQNASHQVVEQMEYEKKLIASNKNSKALNSVPETENLLPLPKTKKVPLVGTIACGTPILTDEQHDSFVMSGTNLDADFCLRAKGDSMIGARIQDGDIVFIKKSDMVANGEIAAVVIEDEATLKRVYYYPEEEKLILSPENPRYAPLVYIGEELSSIKIIGKAVAFQSAIV